MPLTYKIFKDAMLVVTTGSGTVTFGESRAHQDALLADPNFDPSFNQLLNLTGVERFALSVEEARGVAIYPLFAPQSKRALAAWDPAIYGMMRLIEAHHSMSSSASRIQPFYDLPSALQWLGLEKLPE